jgi:DNA-binding XRE family transcriptional regulator
MTSDKYKKIRRTLGLTQVQLAEKLDVTPMTIKRRENGGLITREAELAIRSLQVKPRI